MRVRAIVALVLMSLALTSRTDAAFISYGPYLFSTPDTGSVQTLLFPQFDPSLGTLTSVTYALTQESGSTIQVAFQNRANQTLQFGFFPYLAVDIKTPTLDSQPFSFFPPGFPPRTFQLAPYGGTPNFTAPDSMSGTISFGPNGSDTRTYTGTNFSDFLGTGMVSAQFTASLMFHYNTNLPPNTPASQLPAMEYLTQGTQFGNFTITYNFVIPEPSSWLLMTFGLFSTVGLVLLMKLSRRRPIYRRLGLPDNS